MKKWYTILAGILCAALATPAGAADVPAYNCDYQPSCEVAPGIYGKMSSPVTSKFKLSIGGFVRLDYAYNSVNFGANGAQSPISGAIPAKRITADAARAYSATYANQSQSIFTARSSRLWLKSEGPTFLGARTGALLEADFYGDPSAGAESPMFRMRHAYATLDWERTQILFGQYWDIFGPMLAATIDFRNGDSYGTPNQQRVPQIRLTQKLHLFGDSDLKLVFGVQDPNQFGNNQAAVTGGYGPAVNVASQIYYMKKGMGNAPGMFGLSMNPLTVGLFGLYGTEKAASNGNRHLDSWGYGFYSFVPLLASRDGKCRAMTMSFEGEAYAAANMAFNFATAVAVVGTNPGAVSNTLDPAGNQTPAKGFGYNAQLIFYPTQDLGLTTGYGSRNALNYGSYAGLSNFQKSSSELYVNLSYDFNAAIRLAAEYQNLKTDYGNVNGVHGASATGSDNSLRLVAFYFF
ncbi:MAG TPA: hypothetical protein VF799_03445 [Geobacteraceae bacterium]